MMTFQNSLLQAVCTSWRHNANHQVWDFMLQQQSLLSGAEMEPGGALLLVSGRNCVILFGQSVMRF